MTTYISLVDRLIYGTGADTIITPNHRDWTASPDSGVGWINHNVENSPNSMLTAFENWLQDNNLPPLVPWDGVNWALYDRGDNINQSINVGALPAGLDGSFTGIASLEQLGQAFSAHYQ